VYQDVHLFNDPVLENITYGKPSASEQEVDAVAQAGNAREFIAQRPDGYETLVGERGGRLSGGQRQRIGIACALLVAPAILILWLTLEAARSCAAGHVRGADVRA
jgi:ABC-type multidrug transport system fused ATPase/permease subunit